MGKIEDLKVLFTNVPWYGDNWHGIKAGSRWSFIMDSPLPPAGQLGHYNTYPFFLGYAASYLANMFHMKGVTFYDAIACASIYDKFYETVLKENPEIVVIETSTPSINNDLEVASKLKDMLGCDIALAGPHVATYADELLRLPFVDYILQGEYEVSSLEMCLMRKKGIYKSKPIANINNIPFPVRNESVVLYADGFGQDKFMKYPQLQIWTSRGCPYQCNFCSWRYTMTKGNYRKREATNIIKEITQCMSEYGFKSVLLDDDCFNIGDEHTIAISDALSKISIQWHAMIRPDSCSKEAFYIMRQSGCVGLKVGVETFSQRGLDFIKKGYKSEELLETIDYLIDLGFKVFLSTMNNIPTETDEDKEFTKKWLAHFVSRGASFQNPNYMALPGTPIFNETKPEKEWINYGKYH